VILDPMGLIAAALALDPHLEASARDVRAASEALASRPGQLTPGAPALGQPAGRGHKGPT
jgi:hypothetical protein